MYMISRSRHNNTDNQGPDFDDLKIFIKWPKNPEKWRKIWPKNVIWRARILMTRQSRGTIHSEDREVIATVFRSGSSSERHHSKRTASGAPQQRLPFCASKVTRHQLYSLAEIHWSFRGQNILVCNGTVYTTILKKNRHYCVNICFISCWWQCYIFRPFSWVIFRHTRILVLVLELYHCSVWIHVVFVWALY
jgi:hypothetical protein